MYKDRYQRNGQTITEEERHILGEKKVFIAGSGGLGGYILEFFMRAGVGNITIIDPDSFDESNLNRQLLCREDNLGIPKIQAAAERAQVVNSEMKLKVIQTRLTKDNALELCSGHHILMDALDNISSRLALESCGEELNIPLIHGAIAGSYGQVCAVFPGDRSLTKLYGDHREKGIERELGNPSYTPAIIAGLQVNEALKVLLNKGSALRQKLLYIDLLENEYQKIDLL